MINVAVEYSTICCFNNFLPNLGWKFWFHSIWNKATRQQCNPESKRTDRLTDKLNEHNALITFLF